jgi:hypothetical protein
VGVGGRPAYPSDLSDEAWELIRRLSTTVRMVFTPSAAWAEYEARGTTEHPVLWEYIGSR